MTALRRRVARGLILAIFVCAWLVPCAGPLWGSGQSARSDQPPQTLTDAFSRVRAGDSQGARPLFERALAEARQQGLARWEAEAHRGLAMVLYQERRWDDCLGEMATALELFEEVGDRAKAALVAEAMGNLALERGARSAATDHYRRAIRHAAAVGDNRAQASSSYNLCLALEPSSGTDRDVAEGLRLAEETGATRLAGQIHHCLGDRAFLQGRFRDAWLELQTSTALLEASGDEGRLPLARAWVSLGRLHRVHGRLEAAIGHYERALAVQEQAGDLLAAAQSHNAIAVARDLQGRTADAKAAFERALDRARRSGDLASTTFQTVNLGRWLIRSGEAARGVSMLEALAGSPAIADRENYHSALASGFLALDQYRRAEQEASAALDAAVDADRRVQGLSLRARARRAVGESDLALADAREAVARIEQLRTGVVPNDTMKLMFGAAYADTFSLAIGLLAERGLHSESLAVAEQGRARALADILASRDLSGIRGADPAGSPGPSRAEPPVRGATAVAASLDPGAEPRQSVAVPALSAADLVVLAQRLRSTVVAYWVAADDIFIWTVRADGVIAGARTHVTRARVQRLVRSVWALPSSQLRGATDLDTPATLRELYRLLIQPIEGNLPGNRGTLLTIVPHGPLFGLSFAALRDRAGRYLVERYALHYGASGAVIDQATQVTDAPDSEGRRYVLIADPDRLPTGPDGEPLPALPGSRREVIGVSRLLPASRVTLLAGSDASEPRVGGAARDGRVLHFATHALVFDERPQASFLALSTPPSPTGGGATPPGGSPLLSLDAGDGRLTADEVYSLQLDADLVVLSACRTGLGRLSGDGMIGLTRAFLVAGARSIVASLWDVADEPTAQLMPAFYRAWFAGADKSAALRQAQLGLIRALRAGRVTVDGPRGPAPLPELPVFWATFVLTGEP